MPARNGTVTRPGGLPAPCASRLAASALSALVAFTAVSCAGSRAKSTAAESPEPHARLAAIPEAFHYYAAGNYLSAAGDDSSAVVQFRKALTYDPESREIRLALARSYARQDRFEEAAITAESVRPRDSECLSLLAELYSRLKNPARRQAIFEEWSRVDSSDVQVWRFLANSFRSSGDTLGQVRALSKLALLAPDPALFEQLGLLSLNRGELDSAEMWFRHAVAEDSGQRATRVYLGLAQVFSERSQLDSAKVYYERAVEMNYYNTDLRKRYFYFLMQAPALRTEALEQGRLVLKLSAAEPDLLYRVAILEFDADLLDSAEVHLTRWVAEYGDDGLGRFLLGRIALERGDSVTAEAQFIQSIALADTLPEPYLSLAFLYNRWNQRDSALVVYRTGLSRLPDQSELLFGMGATLEQMGSFDEAVRVFERLIAHQPEHAPALNYLGYMWADKGVRLGEALQLIERAVALQPDNGAYIDSHAWVLYRLGRLQDALARQREALALIHDDAVVYEHYGDILADLGRLDEAVENWQRALSLDPDNATLHSKLNR